MSKCTKCGCGVDKKPLYRTNPTGEPNAGWMCMDCIRSAQPELANNISEDISDVEKDLHQILYGNSNPH